MKMGAQLGMYSIWPVFFGMFMLLALAASPLLKLADTPPNPSPHRISNLDGLRGFLALSVFFYHGVLYHDYISNGNWQAPPSHFFRLIGPFGVDLFFMITGYLFWKIMINSAGEPRWLEFYAGRLFRIAPLYLFATMLALITLFSRTGLVLHVSHFAFYKSLAKLGMLGAISAPSVNGYNDMLMVSVGVTWTLRYEWRFYFALLILGQAARHKILQRALPVVALPALLIYISHSTDPQKLFVDNTAICAALFCIGMIWASFDGHAFLKNLPKWLVSAFVIILLVAAFSLFTTFFTVLPLILLGVVFFLIVSGCDVFGLLSTLPARRLGNASFGIYLLQGLILSWVFSLGPVRKFALVSPFQYWMIVLSCAVLLVVFAAATHFFVEQPGIKLGRSVSLALRKFMQMNRKRNLAIQRAEPNTVRRIELTPKPDSATY